jgi:serine/threonine protein kinase
MAQIPNLFYLGGGGGVLVADMHELTLIHTDLKPENILLVSSEYVKVPDYKVMSYKALDFITCCLSSQEDLTIIIHLKVA